MSEIYKEKRMGETNIIMKFINKHFYVAYTILFLILCSIYIFFFLSNNKTFLYNADGYKQHFRSFCYVVDWLKSIIYHFFNFKDLYIPSYSFSIGYGGDIISTFHYYCIGDILVLPAVFVPSDFYLVYYEFLIFFRLYLAGLAFSKFVSYCLGKDNTFHIFLAMLSYVFSGYTLNAFLMHPYFINPMIYLPMVLYGLEKYFKENVISKYVLFIAVSCVNSFYFFYMITLATIFYGFWRGIHLYKDSFKELCRRILIVLLASFVGCLIGMFILYPVLLLFFSSGRTGVQAIKPLYSLNYYKELATGMFNIDTIGNWSYLYQNPLAIITIFYVISNRKTFKYYCVPIIAMLLGVSLPIVGSLFNGLSYSCNRWSFIVTLFLAFIQAKCFPEYLANIKVMKKTMVAIVIYCVFSCILNRNVDASILINMFLLVVIIIALNYSYNLKQTNTLIICLSLLGIALPIISYNRNMTSMFVDKDSIYKDDDVNSVLEVDNLNNDFFRYSGTKVSTNASLQSKLSSTQFYWSLANQNIDDYQVEIANLENSHYQYNGLDARTIPNLLAGVKYYYSSDGAVPFSYNSIKASVNEKLCKTEMYLPFIYAYSDIIDEGLYKSLNATEKQYAFLRAAYIEDMASSIKKLDFSDDYYKNEYEINESDNVQYSDNKFIVNKDKGSIRIEINNISYKDSELFFYIRGLSYINANETYLDRFVPTTDNFGILVSFYSGDEKLIEKKINYYTEYYKWATNRSDFIVNSTFLSKPIDYIEVTFPKKGIYAFDDIEIDTCLYDELEELIIQRKNIKINKIDFNYKYITGVTNRIEADIDLPKDEIVVFQIPYSEGWTVFADGVKCETYKANITSLAIQLQKGQHEVVLEYSTPGLRHGVLLSLLGWGLFIVMLIIEKRNR